MRDRVARDGTVQHAAQRDEEWMEKRRIVWAPPGPYRRDVIHVPGSATVEERENLAGERLARSSGRASQRTP